MAIFAEARMSMISTKLLKSKSIRSIAVVAAGTAGAQLINVAFTPLITRLYGPEAFGVLGTFLAVLAVITPVASLSYPIAIVLPKQHQEAVRLAVSSMVIAVITSLITALVLWLFKAPIVALFNLQTIEPYLFLLPLSMCFAALVAIASNWILRRKLFNVSARTAVMQSFLANSAKVGLGLFNPVAAMLVVISTVATLVYSIMLWFGISRRPAPAEPPSAEPSASAFELLRRHSDFPLYRTPQIVVNSISQSLPVLMIASLFGPVAAGLYALPKTVLGVPAILIGKSVASVFYPQFVDMVREGLNVRRLLVKSCGSLLLIAVAVYTPVVLFGPWLFSLVFGAQWHESGDYARWMSFWFVATLITRPIVAAIPVLALQGMFLIYEVVSLVLRALAIYVGYYMTQSALGAVAAFSLMNVFAYGVLTYYVIRKAPSG